SLGISNDVRQELLQGLLIELPGQVSLFEESVTTFLTSKKLSDLNQAQRIAHTIKGAANVVSIQGMANLTHYIEDLLETAVKHLNVAPSGFEDMLIQVTDCLATTAEYLNRQGPRPADILQVMQQLLDWLNTLKHDSKPNPEGEYINFNATTDIDIAQENTVSDVNATSSEDAAKATEGNIEEKNTPQPEIQASLPLSVTAQLPIADAEELETLRYINVPEKIAQELLRLSGEKHIANTQISTQLDSLQASLNLTHRYHKKIKDMALQLDALVQTQSALKSAASQHNEDEIDPLELEQFNELHTYSNQLLELTTDSYETISSIDNQIKELTNFSHFHKQLNDDNQQILLQLNLTPAHTLSSRLSRCVRQACRLTGKAAKLNISGESLLMDNGVLTRIADPIMHLLRNAIDHGLEDNSAARTRLGKSSHGNIDLSFYNQGDTIKIVCQDDGRGLDYSLIRQTGIGRGLIDDTTPVNENLLNQMILMPGFSTRKITTHTSGRGIGLDSVIADIRALKGNMTITSSANDGCCITITVPTSILTAHALLVQSRDRLHTQTYAIASRAIEQVRYVDQEALIEKNNRLFFVEGDDLIPVQYIGELLGVYDLVEADIRALLLCRKSNGERVAIAVEKIFASQDIVIKPLNKYSYQLPGVIGATILGDGTVSPVIDLNELPNMNLAPAELALMREQRRKMLMIEKENFVAPLTALVVDDSLSARRSLSQFVADMGMEVYTAKDGFDAINVMATKKPSLLLVDLEMPRMNGLELTTHIRSSEEYKDIPVIMITSRSTDRHKQLARNAGVTTYLTKPWSDDELMHVIEKQIA
ncbi:MAG: chemotaxis protein histidine kinase CheA/ActR/RegA family two-component response regulator, partial [Lentisphaeria bacterium]